MKFKNTLKGLAKLALIPIIAGSSGSCKYVPRHEYEYAGKIGNDSVQFSHDFYWKGKSNIQYNENKLVVKKEDGRHITYIDKEKNNLKIESVEIITLNGKEHCYYMGGIIGESIVKEAQKQFDEYLDKILIEKCKEQKMNEEEATRKKQKEEADILKKVNEGKRLIYQ